MKKLFLILTLAVFALSGCTSLGGLDMSETAGPPGAPPVGPGTDLKVKTIKPVQFTVATLPTLAAGAVGTLAAISDGDSATDCVTGGGSDRVICRWTGSAWENAGDGQAAGSAEVQDEVFSSANFNGDTSHGVSQDDFYDLWHGVDADDDGSFADETWLTTYMTEAEFTSTIGTAYDTEAELNALFTAKQDAATAATDAELAALQADDLVTLSGVAIGSTSLGAFTGSTISDTTIKGALQELETAVEAAGAADAFTVKVDAGATAGYIGAANSDGVIRTDGTVITYADGGDYVTIGAHAYLQDIAGITAAQGDIIYFDGTDWVNLAPSTDGYFLKTQGAGANPTWATPAGGGDITKIGTCETGDCFVDGSTTSTALVFEGTDNAYETTLTAADTTTSDKTITLPDATGTVLLTDGVGTNLTALNGENIQDDTIDDDSIDFSDVTGADLTLTDAVAVTTSGAITSGGLLTANVGLTVLTGQDITLGSTVWNSGDSIDGEQIAADTIDDDSIDFSDVTLADLTFDVGSVSTTEFGYLDGVTGALQDQINGKEATDAEIARMDTDDTVSADWEWQDGIAQSFGNDNDWELAYDETTDDALEFVTAATAAATTTDPMFLIQVDSGDSGMTADQYVFGVYKGTTRLFSVDEDGDAYFANSVTIEPSADPAVVLNEVTASDTDFWFGINADQEGDNDDFFAIGTGLTGGTNSIWTINPSGDVVAEGSNKSDGVILDGGTHSTTIDAGTPSASLTYTWPGAAPASNGYALTSSTGGTLSWSEITASAAGSTGNVQYNDSTLAAEAAFSYNATNNTLSLTQEASNPTLQVGDGTFSWQNTPQVGIEGVVEIDGVLHTDGGIQNDEPLDQNEDVDIDFNAADEEVSIVNSAEYGADGAQVTIQNTDADVGAAMYLLRLRYTDDGQANADFAVFEDNNGDDMITFTDGGAITAAGAITGGSVTDGTVTLVGDGTITGLTAGGLPDNSIVADDLAETLDLSDNTITLGSIDLGDDTMTSIGKLEGADSAIYIDMSTDGYLDLEADTAIRINGPMTFVNEGAITLPANSVDSDQYVDGSIDNAHLSDDAALPTVISGDPDSLDDTLSTNPKLYRGGYIRYNAAGEATLDAFTTAGENVSIQFYPSVAIIVNPNAAQTITLNGTALSQGEALINDSNFGMCVLTYLGTNSIDAVCSPDIVEEVE